MADCDIKITFDKLREIGQEGRNSKVFLVHDHQLDGELVIKEIPKAQFKNSDEFFKEARLMFANKHVNVVEVNYAGMDADNIYISMPYYKNGSLKHLISGGNFLTIRQVIRYAVQFLTGLNHIHSRKLVHFDIKPDNIMIADNNVALLADFGLAKYTDVYGFTLQKRAYSIHVSPEQIVAGIPQSRLTDIYQVGVTLYRMVNGNEFLYAQAPKGVDPSPGILSGKFPNRKAYRAHVPAKLVQIINKCMSVNPADRYDNVLQIINDLASVTSHLDIQLTLFPDGEEWRIVKNEHLNIIQLHFDGTTFTVNAQKEVGGVFQNMNKLSFTSTKYPEVKKHLDTIFSSYD